MKWFVSGILIVLLATAACVVIAANTPVDQVGLVITLPISELEIGGVEANEGGGTLTLALPVEPAQIDPQSAADTGLDTVLPMLFDTLVARTTDGRIVPSLAQNWQLDSDGSAMTMSLRPNVYFQDGNPLNAQAVQATFARFKESGTASPIYAAIQKIRAIDVVDDQTIRLMFHGSPEELLAALATPYAGIFSPESAQRRTESGEVRLVGSGPYLLGDWEPGQSLTLIRNNGYLWAPAVTMNRTQPHVQTVILQVIPDATARVQALHAGTVDVIPLDHSVDQVALQQDPAVQFGGNAWAVSKRIAGVKVGPTGQLLINDLWTPG